VDDSHAADISSLTKSIEALVLSQLTWVRQHAADSKQSERLTALADDPDLPDPLRAASQALAGAPIAALTEMLAEGPGKVHDLAEVQKLVVGAGAQARTATDLLGTLKGTAVPTRLPTPLDEALDAMQKQLAVDVERAAARQVTEEDIESLKAAMTPAEVIAAIVRDSPSEDAVASLREDLASVTALRASSELPKGLTAVLSDLQVLVDSMGAALGPLGNPALIAQLNAMVQAGFLNASGTEGKQ
jgi:hypothetical protein